MIQRLLWWLPFGSVPEISPDELRRMLERDEPVVLLDVRTTLEFDRGHLPGARSVPVQQLSSSLDDLQIPDSSIIVAICKTAHRSIPAVRLLRRHGFEARQLRGGMDAWRKIFGKATPEPDESR